jgi:carbon-monoxide dehydrogenase medium subunit
MMKLRLAVPGVLVDLGRVADLSYVRDAGDHIAIGALTTHHDVEHSGLLATEVPLLAHAASQVGDPQVRHRGSIGGSLAHSDPASDLPAVLLALDATLVATGPSGSRTISIGEFFTGYFESALGEDEVLTEIQVPKVAGLGWAVQKFNRRAQDWAIVGVAAVHGAGRSGVGLVNMGSTPLRAGAVESALAGGASVTDAAAVADEGTEPTADLNASEEYRRHLARVLVRRALEECATRG